MFSLAAWLLGAGAALACQVPVFRYALERWKPDLYEVEVVGSGSLDEAGSALLGRLQAACVERGSGAANFRVTESVAAASAEEGVPSDPAGGPFIILRLPSALERSRPVWAAPFNEGTVQALLDSPARVEIARRILAGDSAVWVLLDSGSAERDAAAWRILDESLGELERTLTLPPPEVIMNDPEYRPAAALELKLKFSALRIAHGDPAERALTAMLLGVEEDLRDLSDQPIAVPVFGRGRALYGLTGEGINGETIRDACETLTGPCSCTIKDQNPGVDLLMSVDWEKSLGLADRPPDPFPELPALPSGPSAPASEAFAPLFGEPPELPRPTASQTEPRGNASGTIATAVLIVLGAALAVAAAGSAFLLRRKG